MITCKILRCCQVIKGKSSKRIVANFLSLNARVPYPTKVLIGKSEALLYADGSSRNIEFEHEFCKFERLCIYDVQSCYLEQRGEGMIASK